MAPAYRAALIPRWVWIIFVISALLILLIALSIAGSRRTRETVISGPPVQTGNPADYIGRPIPTATPTTPPTPSAGQPTTPGTTPTAPADLPQSFTFDGQTWTVAGGPVTLDVQTTGELTGDYIIYVKPGAVPPYKALYLETKPNSGQFYKYVPAQ